MADDRRHRPEGPDRRWSASHVLQIGAKTGEYAVIDLGDARWDYELEMEGSTR